MTQLYAFTSFNINIPSHPKYSHICPYDDSWKQKPIRIPQPWEYILNVQQRSPFAANGLFIQTNEVVSSVFALFELFCIICLHFLITSLYIHIFLKFMICSFSLFSLCHSSPHFSNIQAIALVGKSEMGESLIALLALVTNDVAHTCMYAHAHTRTLTNCQHTVWVYGCSLLLDRSGDVLLRKMAVSSLVRWSTCLRLGSWHPAVALFCDSFDGDIVPQFDFQLVYTSSEKSF